MNRRSTIAGAVLAVMVVGSGCVGFLAGTEPLAFEAEPATVSGAALDGAGYQQDEVRSETITQPFSVAGQEREVAVTNRIATYERSLELGPLGEQELGLFVVLATPRVEVLGRAFNPVGEMSNRELLEGLQSRYDGFEVGDRVETREAVVLGEVATVEKFDARATYGAVGIDLYVHVATVSHGDDFVVAIGIYPQRLPGEEARVFRLYEGIQH